METFLVLNGMEINASIDEKEKVILAITSDKMSREAFIEWLQQRAITELIASMPVAIWGKTTKIWATGLGERIKVARRVCKG